MVSVYHWIPVSKTEKHTEMEIKLTPVYVVASSELEEHVKSDFTISMRHIRPRRKFRISLEALFMIDFPSSRHRLTFYLDRKGKRITVDVQANAHLYSKHLVAEEIDEATTIRSLVVHFQPNLLTLYIDCKDSAKQEIEVNLSKLYSGMEEPMVKLVNLHIFIRICVSY